MVMSGFQLILYGLSAFFATSVLIHLLRQPAMLLGLVDRPDLRKHHKGAVPLSGGPAMVCVFCILALVFGLPPGNYHGLLAGSLILAFLGSLDDLRGLSTNLRFMIQAIVVLTCMGLWGNTELISLGNLLGTGSLDLGIIAVPFTVFCVVGVINAFNLSDGIDGLAGGLALIALISFGIAAIVAVGAIEADIMLLALLAGACLGFLLFNLRTPWRARASVFMGDSGSLFLGFALCWFAVKFSQGSGQPITPVTAVWIMALPIVDTINVFLNRLLRGDGPFTAGRDHLHHILLDSGFSTSWTVITLLSASAVMSTGALIAQWGGISEAFMFSSFIVLSIFYFMGLRRWRSRLTVQTEANTSND